MEKSFYYRVICKPVGNGRFSYFVAGSPVNGRSGEPLFDACRQLKRAGANPAALAALYWEGSPVWTVRCPIADGAALTAGSGRFREYTYDNA